MHLTFEKELYFACKPVLKNKPFCIDHSEDRWFRATGFDITGYERRDLERLLEAVTENLHIRGAKGVKRDIEAWFTATTEGGLATVKARTVRAGMTLLIQYLLKTPRKHVYKQEQDGIEHVMLCYYVEEMRFVERVKRDGYVTPEHIIMDLWYEEFGETHSCTHAFWPDDVIGKNAYNILVDTGLLPETAELREDYEEQFVRFGKMWDKYGMQCLAVGVADDTNIDGGRRERYWWDKPKTLRLDKDGTPSRVVIDVFDETDDEEEKNTKQAKPSQWFWPKHANKSGKTEDDEEEDEQTDESKIPEVPLHPYVACFDLKRHKRIRIHIGNLTKYKYNTEMRNQLILPDRNSRLIDTLLSQAAGTFKDVVGGKTGGIIILCQGPPGTGKTLTSEVCSEALERALYTVQCSQLGTDEEKLEENLLKVLARGRRWGAVMLLDEADVYVHKRGNDLQQNAIVGVFLRVLEYHSGTLFLTTNRGDLVDDAILSRCTARVPYDTPTQEDQIKIWRVLSDANDVDLNLAQIKEIAARNPKASGRDVKNLLKLAMLMAHESSKPIDADLIDEARVFKPTVE